MQHAKTIEAVEVWIECETCEGRGSVLESFRYSGEAYGGYVEVECDECEGTGGYFEDALDTEPFSELKQASGWL